jgi:hypothetical protein
MTRPLSSTTVMITLPRMLSVIPRALRAATSSRNTMAAGICGTSNRGASSVERYWPANASDSPAALTTPAASIEKPTRNEITGCRKARSAKIAAPPALGYLVTSSA